MAEDWQKWQKQFRALEEYHRLNPSRWPGPNTRFPGRNALGAWCARQQREYKRDNLRRPRLKKLLDLGFPFLTEKSQWERRRAIYTYHERGWLLRFEDLRAYRRKHPDKWPKSTDTDPLIRSLGKWLSKNRRRSLRPEFKRLLKTMGFDFICKDRNALDRQWNMQFWSLQEFRKKNPRRWPQYSEKYPPGNNLGTWVHTQRQRKKRGALAPEREKKLRSIGFVFILRNKETLDAQWNKQFRLLQKFRKKNPYRWPSPTHEFPKGNNLGKWASRQRNYEKKGVMPSDRKRKLQDIGFDFAPDRSVGFDARWNRQFRHLQEFRKEYPHRWPKQKEEYPKENYLGNWVNRQRQRKKKGVLPPDKEQKLRDINFAPAGRKALDTSWEAQYKCLQKFRKENPYRWPAVKEEYPAGNKLGVWMDEQRYRKKKSVLQPGRERKLLAIDFVFVPGYQPRNFEPQWNKQFKYLQDFRKKFPHRWPIQREEYPEGNKLGTWVTNQRQKKRKGTLQPEWEEKLRTIGFEFAPKERRISEAWRALWNKQFNHLQTYRKKNPHHWPAKIEEFPKGNKLGYWVHSQRRNYKKGNLRSERRSLLEVIGFPAGKPRGG